MLNDLDSGNVTLRIDVVVPHRINKAQAATALRTGYCTPIKQVANNLLQLASDWNQRQLSICLAT
jgi:hypothetical protein